MNKLQKKYLLILILFLIFNLRPVISDDLANYLYFSSMERTRFNEIIWFSTGDTLDGPVRSNDYIGFKHRPVFLDRVIGRGFRYWDAEPDFAFQPVVGRWLSTLPDNLDVYRRNAMRTYDSRNGQFMTWIKMFGEAGMDVYQYRIGMLPRDSLIDHIGMVGFGAIFIDGQVEIEGEMAGQLVIASSDDMWLIDNIRYIGSDPITGDFDDDRMNHMLGLATEGNIIVKDNWVNGRANGYGIAPDNPNRHSIVITAALLALGESFTFEHLNNEWDAYQGPYPDDRGFIYLRGSLAQRRRGALNTDNHGGTGYRLNFWYDGRLSNYRPFGILTTQEITGNHQRLRLNYGSFWIHDAYVDDLVISDGAEIMLDGPNALTVYNRLEIRNSVEYPVIIRTFQENSHSVVHFDGGIGATVDIDHTDFTEGIEIQFEADTIRLSHSSFNEVNWFTGNVYADSCIFMETTHLECWEEMQVERCVFREGVEIRGNVQNGSFTNNTVVGGRYAGIEIDRFRNLTITNNIVAFNRQGIVNSNYEQPVMSYNDVYGNWSEDYVDCQTGQGSISVDPRLLDWERGDYHSGWGSPCIDAGDPNAPLDPDGSRSDMGAYPFHNVLTVPQPETVTPIEFALSAAPNPFNCSTRINLALPSSGWVTLALYDVQGRATYSQNRYFSGGCHRIYLTGDDFGAPGVYFVRAVQGDAVKVVKVVYLP